MRNYVVKSKRRGGPAPKKEKVNPFIEIDRRNKVWREADVSKLSSPWDARKPLA